ncbi:MAG: peptidyl-prolyl cis-trans isomerase [Armatimonadota bacterium]|nr:peptidyl-prolyl cis-trans isomerase [Armatimonadota bacterium]MCX7778293.1 peptidyl-prolyl cis-trans isomerase [Armatimonadota bacterium]MDW8026319.1 peptidyl-prolyl cis-trans isomerase [Armatimonadota bacterium]
MSKAICWQHIFLPLLFPILLLCGCRRSEIVATVNGKPITQDEFWHTLESRHGVTTLITLIDRKLLSQANRRMRLVDEFYVSRELEKRIEEFGGKEAFKDFLRKANMTEKLFRDDIRAHLVLESLRSAEASKLKPTEKVLRAHFDALKKRFGGTQWARVRVIETFSKEDAQSFYEQLLGGTPFAELAKKFNIREETRRRAGEIGALPLDPTVTEERLIKAVKGLKVGQFSKPMEIGGLWVIVKLEGVLSEKQLSFELARPFVEAEYRRVATPSHAEVLQKMRDEADVKVQVEVYKAVERIYGRKLRAEKQNSKVKGD